MVDWAEYSTILKKLYEDLRYTQFDDIVAIGRGGSVIGAYLASKLDIPTFYPIFLRHIGKDREKRVKDSYLTPYGQIRSLKGRLLIVSSPQDFRKTNKWLVR